MDIPNNNNGDNVPRIRNIHPSQLSPDHHYGATDHFDEHIPIERTTSTFSERLESFVGSYSRTSMMFMAENLTVPNGSIVSVGAFKKRGCWYFTKLDEEEDKYSGYYTSVSRIPSTVSSRLSRVESGPGASTSHGEHASLLFSHLDKVLSTRSVGTVADDYRYEPPTVTKKSSFTQSIFNSINILIGIGILALPLGFKVRKWKKKKMLPWSKHTDTVT